VSLTVLFSFKQLFPFNKLLSVRWKMWRAGNCTTEPWGKYDKSPHVQKNVHHLEG